MDHYEPIEVKVIPPAAWPNTLSDFLDLTGLKGVAPVEAWTIEGSNAKMGYSTHGLFRYFGKFPPPIATKLIADYTSPHSLVLDPMCGSGTTGVESLWMGRRALLSDVSPLATLVSRVKTTSLARELTMSVIERIARNYELVSPDDFMPTQVRDPAHWFLPATIDSLRRLRLAVEQESESAAYDYARVAFASCVRRVSKATTQQGRLFLDVETALEDALPTFMKNAERGISRVGSLPFGDVKAVTGDARLLAASSSEQADLAIVHPPYFNSYSYTAINTLELGWLNVDRRGVRKGEVREYFKVAQRADVDTYLGDLTESLEVTGAQVRSSGILAVMMGDTRLRGEHVRVIQPLLGRLSARFALEKIALRIPKFTEASWAASQRRESGKLGVQMYDFILVFRMNS